MPIQNIFPTPIFQTRLNREFTKEEIEVAHDNEKEHNKNYGNSNSKNNYVLNNPKLANIRTFLETSVAEYAQEVLTPKNKIGLYITQSWFNYTSPKEFHHQHWHQNSIFSGVLYFNGSGESDKITFHKEVYQRVTGSLEITPEEYNEYNSMTYWFPCVTGELFIFPSNLQHSVEKTKSASKRISLAFNTFVSGDLGNANLLNHLVLR
jgi:uncharacterized protein (TIGR02466 family)